MTIAVSRYQPHVHTVHNPGKRVALFAEYFLSLSFFVFFFFFFFLSKEKVDTFTQANIVRSRSD